MLFTFAFYIWKKTSDAHVYRSLNMNDVLSNTDFFFRQGIIIIPTQNTFVAKHCKNKRFHVTQKSKHNNIILLHTIHIYKCRIVL